MKLVEATQRIAKLEAELEALKAAVGGRYYKIGQRQYIALPLTSEEQRAVEDYAANEASNNVGEGILVDGSGDLNSDDSSTFDYVVDWRFEEQLPHFAGLLIRATYNHEAGHNVIGIWGLRQVA